MPNDFQGEPESNGALDFEAWAKSVEAPRTGVAVVVDDEQKFAHIEGLMLASLGFKVFTTQASEEALRLVNEHHPDLVLLDFMMPGVNGLQLLQQIKASHPATCVIMVTGKRGEETAIEAMKAGASDYILKPLPAAEVSRPIIDRALRLRDAELKSQLYVERLEQLNAVLSRLAAWPRRMPQDRSVLITEALTSADSARRP